MDTEPRTYLQPFKYEGVRLLPGRLQKQFTDTRDFYFSIPDDDILKGFRQQAELPAPGKDMGGWCSHDTGVVFGQWLSGMARISKAIGDTALRDKAIHLMTEWSKALPKLKYGHYVYDKYVCGLLDLFEYAGCSEALGLLEQITGWASENLSRRRLPATDDDTQGGFFTGDGEWYTLSENLYRAYQLTGDARYRAFGDVWRYPYYWDMFTGKRPLDPHGVHGYSHVNTLSSAAMAYAVTGDADYLQTIVHAYDYFQQTQCYATGGYAPGEKLMRPNGELGESIVVEPNDLFLRYFPGRSFETPCGSWAVFKLGRYLLQFTGEARYGDWMEQMVYNGIGASLPMVERGSLPMFERGRTLYYADYRLMGGSKFYFPDPWPCCSGTYIQAVADYHNIIYFHSADGLYVNLYLPSEVTWNHNDQQITLYQWTDYPESEAISLSLQMRQSASFGLRFRVPGWAKGVTAEVNSAAVEVAGNPGAWAEIRRTWESGDRVSLKIAMEPRLVPIDAQHPYRVAVAQGPMVLVRVQDASRVTSDRAARWIAQGDRPGEFVARFEETKGTLVPFYRVGHGVPYRMYFDLQSTE